MALRSSCLRNKTLDFRRTIRHAYSCHLKNANVEDIGNELDESDPDLDLSEDDITKEMVQHWAQIKSMNDGSCEEQDRKDVRTAWDAYKELKAREQYDESQLHVKEAAAQLADCESRSEGAERNVRRLTQEYELGRDQLRVQAANSLTFHQVKRVCQTGRM